MTNLVEFTAGPVSPQRISTLSLEYIAVPITALDGTGIYNPTADTVQMAFLPVGQDPVTGDWKTAAWETVGAGPTIAYRALCLVGPGGTITLSQGEYAVWVKVTDTPSVPVLEALDSLTVV